MVHVLQLMCVRRHCFVAIAWDDASNSLPGASVMLGKATTDLLGDRGAEAFVCALCGSTTFHQEDGVTRFRTMAEAMPHLKRAELDQLVTRELLTRTADRN
jgi:hypothetical protein